VQSPHSCSNGLLLTWDEVTRSLAAVLMRMVTGRVRIELPGRFALDAISSVSAYGHPGWRDGPRRCPGLLGRRSAPAAVPGSLAGSFGDVQRQGAGIGALTSGPAFGGRTKVA
jgi:hypothetical protein